MSKKTFSKGTAATVLFAGTEKPPVATAPTAQANTDGIFTWRAQRDGEKRDRRLQITCKQSIATKAATLAKTRGISLNYLFERLIMEEWERQLPND